MKSAPQFLLAVVQFMLFFPFSVSSGEIVWNVEHMLGSPKFKA